MFAHLEWLPSALIYALAIFTVIVARLSGVSLGEVPIPRKRAHVPPPPKPSPKKARTEDIELEITDSPTTRGRRPSDEGEPGEIAIEVADDGVNLFGAGFDDEDEEE